MLAAGIAAAITIPISTAAIFFIKILLFRCPGHLPNDPDKLSALADRILKKF
jgi:hypothetical protein